MARFSTKPLDEKTWPDFARLVEKHNGVWGGYLCMIFHGDGTGGHHREEKERRVREGRAHAALVYDGAAAAAALKGALQEIVRLGGGTVESYPEGVKGRSVSGSFFYNATVSMFERQGFKRRRRLGKTHWVVDKVLRGGKEKT